LLWFDNWIGNYSLAKKFNIHYDNVLIREVTVRDFILPNKEWNLTELTQVLNNHPIIQSILGISTPFHDIDNSFIWGLSGLG